MLPGESLELLAADVAGEKKNLTSDKKGLFIYKCRTQVHATTGTIDQNGVKRTFPKPKRRPPDPGRAGADPCPPPRRIFAYSLSLSHLLIRASSLFRDRICREIVFRLPQQLRAAIVFFHSFCALSLVNDSLICGHDSDSSHLFGPDSSLLEVNARGCDEEMTGIWPLPCFKCSSLGRRCS
ncbi:hypothetical protein CEXT_72391 [Caerostris extrusa]|uniref:Uncharacterized protein n=1 Tax=Caerostris extrusa TaxID=172846 RepID=A0AAV4M5B6_CAEEX|nr:hypothetical protein CEXT_72391 [Caerostris extrusa]